MKKLFAILFFGFAISAQAQAVNNRTFTWTPGAVVPTAQVAGYRLYCGVTADPNTFSTVPVRDIAAPATTSGVVPLADTLRFCALKAYPASGPESPFSNVVPVTAPNAPILQITSIDTFVFNRETGKWEYQGREVYASMQR